MPSVTHLVVMYAYFFIYLDRQLVYQLEDMQLMLFTGAAHSVMLLLTSLYAFARDQAPSTLAAGAGQAARLVVAVSTLCAALCPCQRVFAIEWYCM
jgi:hypothetical protein